MYKTKQDGMNFIKISTTKEMYEEALMAYWYVDLEAPPLRNQVSFYLCMWQLQGCFHCSGGENQSAWEFWQADIFTRRNKQRNWQIRNCMCSRL